MSKPTRIHKLANASFLAAVFTSLIALIFWLTSGTYNPGSPVTVGLVTLRLAESLWPVTLLWLAALGYGIAYYKWVFRKACGHRVGLVTVGMAVLLIIQWLCASIGFVGSAASWLVCLPGLVIALTGLPAFCKRLLAKDTQQDKQWLTYGIMWFVPVLAMLIIASCCPPGTLWRVEAFAYDVTSYHLQLPQEWLTLRQMTSLNHSVYSYLPGLIEGGYLLIASFHKSTQDAVYACQIFHGSLALLAAMAAGQLVSQLTQQRVGVGVAALFLSAPWVLITGSLAYNEMGVLAFGAGAMLIVFSEHGRTRGGAAAAGLLVSAATLCKLTAGIMIALPVGLILLIGLNRINSPCRKAGVSARNIENSSAPPQPPPSGGGYGNIHRTQLINLQLAAVAAFVGLLTLSPYLIRNYVQTGNPVFPFAADVLGQGHWDDELVERWNQGHGLAQNQEGRLDSLARQWLLNTGYGAVGGTPTPRETQNIARFDREGGVPVFWIAVFISAVLVLMHKNTRRTGGALLLMIGLQLVFWLFFTHLQSRFLLPTLLPACLLAGLGYGRLHALTKTKAPTAAPLVGSAVLICMIAVSYMTLNNQTRTIPDPDTGEPLQTPIWMAINTDISNSDHPINRLPETSKTLMVADSSGLLYLDRPFVYASAFDEAPLGRFIREAEHDPQQVNQLLQAAGITHVWVHWAELDRLHSTYGHDSDVTAESLQSLINTGWHPVESLGLTATLFALPGSSLTTEITESTEKKK